MTPFDHLVYESFTDAWVTELAKTRQFGELAVPRGLTTFERRWVQFAVEDPMTFPIHVDGRVFSNVIGVLEGTSLVGQFSVPELFTDHVKKFAEYYDGGTFHGSYGARAHGLLGDVVNVLKADPDSRQAVLTIFDATRDLYRAKRDIPCTIACQFMIRKGLLEQRVTMRSNDLWLGTPYDFAQFGILQASLAQALGVGVGKYVHAVGSLHLYERDFNMARNVDAPFVDKRMGFPLWDCEPDQVFIRARDIALQRVTPATEFERWAHSLLS